MGNFLPSDPRERRFATLDSTQVEARRALDRGRHPSDTQWPSHTPNGDEPPAPSNTVTLNADEVVWIRANAQTGGRGRLDRHWVSEPGNLFVSAVFHPPPMGPPTVGGFVVALAVLDAVERLARSLGAKPPCFGLKWPNDIIVADPPPGQSLPPTVELGAKVGGILAELCPTGELIVGLGLNVASRPDLGPGEASHAVGGGSSIPTPATACLVDFGVAFGEGVATVDALDTTYLLDALASTPSPPTGKATRKPPSILDRLVTALYDAFDERRRVWALGAVDVLLGAYRRRLFTLGRRVRVDMNAGTSAMISLVGTAVDVAPDFALIVVDDEGRRHEVHVGDCLHLRGA